MSAERRITLFDELMLHGDMIYTKAGAGKNTVFIQMRLPWYRGLPVSCIERLEVTLDGTALGPDKARLIVGGVPLMQKELSERYEETWFNLDSKEVELTLDGPLAEGKHQVSALMRLRIPYFRTSPDPTQSSYTQYAVCDKIMRFSREDE